jgi:hypothetical protein
VIRQYSYILERLEEINASSLDNDENSDDDEEEEQCMDDI